MDEKELIEQLRQGDEPAFRWLVNHYRNRVYHAALNLLQNHKDAEDAAQETFIEVYRSINGFREEASLATWINRIATRKAIDKLRRNNTREKWTQWWGKENKEEEVFEHPGVLAENKEKAAILFTAIQALPEKQRIAFTLIKVQGLSYEEACGILQQNIKAVESLIGRARTNLQKLLADHYKQRHD